jgi:hypothetical protein
LASLQVKRHAQARSVLLSVLALLYSTAVLGEGRIRGRDDPALIRLAQSPETMTLQRLDSIEPWLPEVAAQRLVAVGSGAGRPITTRRNRTWHSHVVTLGDNR